MKTGESVTRGQLLGLLGNSGNSTGPHLHFHLCDRPSALACDGIPYVFDQFSMTQMKMAGEQLADAHAIAEGTPSVVTDSLPWGDVLTGFPAPLP